MPLFDVLTVGSATQDIFLRSKRFEVVPDEKAPEGFDVLFPFGAKIDVDDIYFATGGGATNAAVTFAHFGLKTACVTRIGKDQAGKNVIADLKKNRVAQDLVQIDPEHKTDHSVILLSGAGHRAILSHRDASAHLDTSVVPWKSLSVKWLYVTSVAANLALLHDAFAFAKTIDAQIAWNPGRAELDLGIDNLEGLLSQTAVLILNREEAALLSDKPAEWLPQIVERLSAFPGRALVITDGGNGAYVTASDKTYFAKAFDAERVNTTGAGDAFGSGFVATLAKDLDIKTALGSGMLNATGVVTHMGAKAGILKSQPSPSSLKKVIVKEELL